MTVLVVGATGRTGRVVVELLLEHDHHVRVIVRSPDKLGEEVLAHPNLQVIRASVLDLSDEALAAHVRGCDAVVSCLGHVMSFKGLFGHPRRLCTEAARRLCHAIASNEPTPPTRFILMNTVGVANPELDERRTRMERLLLFILRYTVPPHRDNEEAARFLLRDVGRQHAHIEWCAVRPDSLIDAPLSPYDIKPSPTTGLISGRPTARANVAHFMTTLIEDDALWRTWKFAMPVVMNADSTQNT